MTNVAPVADDTAQQVVVVPIEELAPHPDNVRARVGNVDELAASVQERGILQPLTVVSLDAFLASNPDVQGRVEIGNWVVIAGHRRLAAARQAGVDAVPVIVRDDLAGDTDALTTMIVENVQRAGLTALEEARAFGRLRDKGWSQRDIAKATGVSPGQVHKRLQLLRLPTTVAAALDAGKLPVADALKLLELPDEEIQDAWVQAGKETWRGIAGVVAAREATRRGQQTEQRLRSEYEAAGLTVVDSRDALCELIGNQPWNHSIEDVETVAELTDPAATIAHLHRPAGSEHVAVYFYARTPLVDEDEEDGDSDRSSASTGSAQRAEAERESAQRRERDEARRAAGEARAHACRRLLAGSLPVELAAEILTDTMLNDEVLESYSVAETAADWCGALDQIRSDDGVVDGDALDAWMLAQGDAGGVTARRAAVAIALADLEFGLTPNWTATRPWTSRQCRHVRRLIAHAGYTPTDYDTERLAAAEADT